MPAPAAGVVTAIKVINLVLTVASVAYMIASRPNGKDRRDQGGGFLYTENPSDPQTPQPIPDGAPQWVPPILFEFTKPKNVNSLQPNREEARVTGLHLGAAGPGGMDGRDLGVWRNGQKVFEDVLDDDGDTPRELTWEDRPDGGLKYRVARFPNFNVIPDSVTIYVDGVQFGVGGATPTTAGNLGPTIVSSVSQDITNSSVVAKQYYNPLDKIAEEVSDPLKGFSDDNVPRTPNAIKDTVYSYRYGFFLPLDGVIEAGSLQVTAHRRAGTVATIRFRSGTLMGPGVTSAAVPAADLHFSNLDGPEKKSYVYVSYVEPRVGPSSGQYVDRYTVSYRVRPTVQIVERGDGVVDAVFANTQTSDGTQTGTPKKVTASYRWRATGGEVSYVFRDGSPNQDPLPVDDTRNTFDAGREELLKNQPRTYETENEVHDIVVGVESNPIGFYDQAQAGKDSGDTRDTKRSITLRIKTSTAPDAEGTNYDPTTGWIKVRHNITGLEDLELKGQTTGTAKWAFSMADLLRWTAAQDETPSATGLGYNKGGTNYLDLDRYVVEVMATDDAGLDFNGTPAGQRIQSRIYLATATEVLGYRFQLPGEATLTITEENVEEFAERATWAVQFKARRHWVPAANATPNPDTGRPEPGQYEWTRNPVHIAVGLIRDHEISAGRFFKWEHIDLASWLEAAAFCDEEVENADGTKEVRSEYDGVIRERSALHDHVATILSGQAVMPIQSGGVWKFKPDRDETPVLHFDDLEDIEAVEVGLTYPSREALVDEMEISYPDETIDHQYASELVRLREDQGPQRVRRRVDYYGCRRRTQVRRHGSIQIRAIQEQRIGSEWRANNFRAKRVEAGDIVTVTVRRYLWDRKKFRIMATGFGSNLKTGLQMTEHNPEKVYGAQNLAPSTPLAPPPALIEQQAILDENPVYTAEQFGIEFLEGKVQIDVGTLPPEANAA